MKSDEIITVRYESSAETRFIIDDDSSMEWVGVFPSGSFDRFFVVLDEAVERIWGEIILAKLRQHRKPVFTCVVAAQESSKSLGYYPRMVDFMEANQCTRYDLVIAIGGGILIDLMSFTVSTYMRGVPFYVFATTLIGQVDASTAGKTCLNTVQSKNLLGTFYYPLVVYNNIHFLHTNPRRFLRQGFSEIFKYGLLHSRRLIDDLLRYRRNPETELLKSIIRQTIDARVVIRKKDPLVSNLGHTFGHAIEKYSGYRILHGDAISVGTVVALNYAECVGMMAAATVKEIIGLMKELGLNLYLDKSYDAGQWVQYMLRDKKSSSAKLNLVMIRDIAVPYEHADKLFFQAEPRHVRDFLARFIASYPFSVADCISRTEQEDIVY